jgi:glycosyltransferase involved in cell wall biosynthesis
MKEKSESPKVSVIIPFFTQMECSPAKKFPYFTYGDPIEGCIESVEAQNYENMEILYADTKNPLGGGAIRNEAIERATGDIIFFVCSDAVMIGNDCVSKLVEVFNRTHADVIIGSSIPSKSHSSLFVYLLCLEYEEREINMGEGCVDAGATTYFGIKKEVLDEVGGFPLESACINTGNLHFDSGFADWDFCGLLREKNYKIWHTLDVTVHHAYQTDALSYFKKQFLQAWYRIAYLKRFKRVQEGYTTCKMGFPVILLGLVPVWILLGLLIGPIGYYLAVITLVLTFFWQTDSVLKYFKNTKDFKVFLLLPISFLRSISWFLGALKGFLDFYFLAFLTRKSCKQKSNPEISSET